MQPIDAALLDALTGLVVRAGRAILAIDRDSLATREKDDHSPVTAADLASQAVLLDGLARLMPGMPVVSEENDAAAQPGRLGELFALVDPLDATNEFVAGTDQFCVNLAIVAPGRPIAGIVYLPARGTLYRGRVGGGAERVAVTADDVVGAAVPIRTRARPPAGLIATVSRSHLDPRTVRFLEALGATERLPAGSAGKFGLVAEGAADVYPRLAPTHEWDVAAGHAVVAAAGGTVLRPDDGRPLGYGDVAGGFLVPGFVAWGDPGATVQPDPSGE